MNPGHPSQGRGSWKQRGRTRPTLAGLCPERAGIPETLPRSLPAPREPARPLICLPNLLGTSRPALPPSGAASRAPRPGPFKGRLPTLVPPPPRPQRNVSLGSPYYGAPGGQNVLRLQGACAERSHKRRELAAPFPVSGKLAG